MTVLETYPLHRCIYRNDVGALKELLTDKNLQERINECDNHGNTPIHLALMLNRHLCINVLLQYNCDVFTRNFFGWNPMDEASMIGDVDIIEKIAYRKWEEYISAFTQKGGFFDQWNEKTPCLYIKLKMKIKTTIPILKKFGARDIELLYKKGKNYRFDTSIGGIDTRGIPKIIRKPMSIYHLYEEKEGINKIYLLDHKKKLYQEFFPNMPEWFLQNLLNSKLGANTIYNFSADVSKFHIKMIKGNILKKNTKTFTLESGKTYKCDHYSGKNATIYIKKRNDEAVIGECESIIKNEKKVEELSYKKIKNMKKNKIGKIGSIDKHSSIISNQSTSKASSSESLEDDSDSDSDSILDDSDDDDDDEESDNENNNSFIDDSRKNMLPKDIDNYDDESNTENGEKSSSNENKTVTYTINENGTSKTFEKTTEMEDRLDWEEAFHEKYAQNSDLMYHLIKGRKDGTTTKLKKLSYKEVENLHLKKISEEEYFDPSSTDNIHIGRIMNITEEKKIIKNKIKYWMVKKNSDFPISSEDIQPIFKFVMMILLDQIKSNRNANEMDKVTFERMTNDLFNFFKEKDIFPIKTSVPFFPSVALQNTFLDASKDPKYVPDELFKIPSDYKPGRVFFEYRHK